jgi:hypothetical protein
VFAIFAFASSSTLKRSVSSVAASGESLLGSIGAAPPFGVAIVISAPLSDKV